MSKKVVAIFTTSEGHQSIAEAVSEALHHKYDVRVFYKRDDLMNVYVFLYQFFPSGYKLPFMLSQNKHVMKFSSKFYLERYLAEVSEFIEKHKPDILINTFVMYNWTLEHLATKYQLPLLNVITDPWTIHPLLISGKARSNLVFDQKSINVAKKLSPQASLHQTGWLVRKNFEETYQKDQVRKQLRLQEKILTFVITSGSEGTNIIGTILPYLIAVKRPLQIVIACGNNKTLFRSAKALSNILKKMHSKCEVIPLQFTKQLHLYMQAADLIVGKAGPNTLFESVATLTPFFAITHVAGQEDGNLDLIREYKLGYVEENPLKAGKLIKRIIAHPEELTSFHKNLETLAEYNKKSKEKLLAQVDVL